MNIEPRFIARGNAVSFAGRITRLGDRAVDHFIEINDNSASLPVTGGLSRSETGRFALLHDQTWPEPIVSFSSGSTRTWEEGREKTHLTHVMAVIHDLAIAGRFFAARAAAYLQSTYRRDADEPDIFVRDASITGLRCDQYGIEVRWRTDVLNKLSTFRALRDGWARSREGDALAQAVLQPPGTERHNPQVLPAVKGYVIVALCELAWVDKPHPEVELDGHILRWPGFGKVTFGEMLISPHSRRLTVMRFNLGSPFAMDGSAIDVESNGVGLP